MIMVAFLIYVADIVLFCVSCSIGAGWGIFIFGIIGAIFTISIIYGIVESYAEAKQKKQVLAEAEKESREIAEQYKKVLESLFGHTPELLELCDLYYPQVKNYISVAVGKDEFWLVSQMHVAYSEFYVFAQTPVVKQFLSFCGFSIEENSILYSEVRIKTIILRDGLQERLRTTIQWSDTEVNEDIIACVTILIVRNGIVRYFYESWMSSYGWESIEEIVDNISEAVFNANRATLTTSYCCYCCKQYQDKEKDPIHLCEDIDQTPFTLYSKYQQEFQIAYAKTRNQNYKNEIFSTSAQSYITGGHDEENEIERWQYMIDQIDVMSGDEFEKFVTDFFEKRGFTTKQTPSSGDYGVDVIAENDFIKIGIQVKRYNGKVQNSAVQEAVTAMRHYSLDKAMVITNSYFQPSAIQLAKDNHVILWNRDKLIEEIKKES